MKWFFSLNNSPRAVPTSGQEFGLTPDALGSPMISGHESVSSERVSTERDCISVPEEQGELQYSVSLERAGGGLAGKSSMIHSSHTS